MKRKIFSFVLQITLILATIRGSLLIESIEIVRKDDQKGDAFKVPSALLTTSGCFEYGAGVLNCDSNSCLCQCTWPKSTLTIRNGKWECIADEFIRTREGCGVFFSKEKHGGPLPIIKNKFSIPLRGISSPPQSGSINCNLAKARSGYMDCNNTWVVPPTTQEAWNSFSFSFSSSGPVLTIIPPDHPLINGKIIKLVFTEGCTLSNKSLERCLIFKRPGSIQCNVSKLPLLQLAGVSSTVSPPSSSFTVSNTPNQGVTPSSIKSTLQSSHNVLLFTPSTTTKAKDRPDDEKDIIPVVSGVISTVAVVTLVIVTVIILRYRKRRMETYKTGSGCYETPVNGAEYGIRAQRLNTKIISRKDMNENGCSTSDSRIYASTSHISGNKFMGSHALPVYDYAKPDRPVTRVIPANETDQVYPLVYDYALPDGPLGTTTNWKQVKPRQLSDNSTDDKENRANNEHTYHVLEGADPHSPPPPLYRVLEGSNPNGESDSDEEEEPNIVSYKI